MSVTESQVQNALMAATATDDMLTMSFSYGFDDTLDYFREMKTRRVSTPLGEIEIVDQELGDWNIDDEQSIFMVFHLDGQYFRADGTYSSWNDAEWEGHLYEVERVPVPQYTYKPI